MAEHLIPRELSASLNAQDKDKELALMAREIDWKNPASAEDRYLFANEIVREAEDLVKLVDPTPMLLESRNYGKETTNIKFRNVAGFEAKTVTAGGHKDTIRVDNEFISMPIPRQYDHVSIEMLKDDLETATYGDIATLREGIATAMLRKKINTVWAACNDAITSADETGGTGNGNFIRIAGSAITEDAVNYAIDHVDSYAGGVYSILGHPSKVNEVNNFTGFRSVWPEQAKSDYWKLGFLGMYRGANVVKMPLSLDDKYNMAPVHKLAVFVLGSSLGEIANIYDMQSETWDIPSRDVQVISAQMKYVVLTWQASGGFKIKLTQ